MWETGKNQKKKKSVTVLKPITQRKQVFQYICLLSLFYVCDKYI